MSEVVKPKVILLNAGWYKLHECTTCGGVHRAIYKNHNHHGTEITIFFNGKRKNKFFITVWSALTKEGMFEELEQALTDL